ncbi:MAG: hypothetical protein ACJ8DS_01040 [Microvirga sp.]
MSTDVTVTHVNLPRPAGPQRLRAGAGAAFGKDLGPIPGNVSDTVKLLQKQLCGTVTTMFAARFPHADANPPMTGIMGPWTLDQSGTAPKCAVDQITLDFEDWGIDADPTTISRMVMTITRHLAGTMGETGAMPGSTAVTGPAKTIQWCVGWALADVGQNIPPDKGVIYAYTAAEGAS